MTVTVKLALWVFFDELSSHWHSALMSQPSQLEQLLPEMRAYAQALCERRETAEDLVQDAFERAIIAQDKPGGVRELRPWIFRVIRNLRYDELRKRRVRREYLSGQRRLFSEGHLAGDHSSDVLSRLAFERLPTEKREILLLIDVVGLKYGEAAEVIGVATGTVMSRLSRARKALREEVDGKLNSSVRKAE